MGNAHTPHKQAVQQRKQRQTQRWTRHGSAMVVSPKDSDILMTPRKNHSIAVSPS